MFLTHDYLVLVMEYAGGGDLYHHGAKRRGLRESEARWVFQQIMLAVDYCHRMVSRGLVAGWLPVAACLRMCENTGSWATVMTQPAQCRTRAAS